MHFNFYPFSDFNLNEYDNLSNVKFIVNKNNKLKNIALIAGNIAPVFSKIF